MIESTFEDFLMLFSKKEELIAGNENSFSENLSPN